MKLFYKKIETCKDCPNLSEGSMYNCMYNKKNPEEINSFLSMIDWMKDKENVKYPFTIPDWCPLDEYQEKIEVNETGNVWVKIK